VSLHFALFGLGFERAATFLTLYSLG
jgi:hypothetical protein